MNPLKVFCLMTCLIAAVAANPSKKQMAAGQRLQASQWLSPSELESIPAVDDITLERLESMPLEKGAQLVERLYHLSQINHDLAPQFVPSPSNIPVYIWKSNGQKQEATLNTFVQVAKQQSEFGREEVTIFITGLPKTSPTVEKAIRSFVEAYLERYNLQAQRKQYQTMEYAGQQKERTSSEEDYSESWKNVPSSSGTLVIIDLGSTLTTFKRYAMLDTVQTGAMIAKTLVELTQEADVPQEIMHIVAQGIAAHVAGAAGNEYTRLTGHKLRRITALDPSKVLAKDQYQLTMLTRGDADFVDAIHTSVYGMGTIARVGDVDFYPNGPSAGVPGADNVVEASMRAVRYFAETVRPGYERNFPAVPANSLRQYKSNNGFGRRAYMGIDTDYDLQGDYLLQVNPSSPFGQRAPATKQSTYHGMHESWKQESWKQGQEY